jgi:hypothetical protein
VVQQPLGDAWLARIAELRAAGVTVLYETDDERRAVRGEDLLDGGFGFVLIAQVDHDYGVASARERARDLAAGPARAAGDDRHWVGSRHEATLAAIAGGRTSGFPGTPSLVV